MPYRKPGAYARFIPTAGAVNSPGATRIMAIVGTGTMFYDIVNEAVVRTSDMTADKLAFDNVFEITSVTDKPLKADGTKPSGTKTYVAPTDFTIADNAYIAWNTSADATATINNAKSNTLFATKVSVTLDAAEKHLARTGSYKVEIVTTGDAGVGTFRVTDLKEQSIIGEFVAGASGQNNIIPGFSLTVSDTSVHDDGPPVKDTIVGDYVVIDVVKGTLTDTTLPSAVYVSYTYKKPTSEVKPKVFFDYDDIVAEYGNYDVTAAGKVINSLSLGAEIAFLNGVNPIVCVQANDDSAFEMQAAIDKLEKAIPGVTNVNTIIALTTDPTVNAHLADHVTKMSSYEFGKERMCYVGAAKGLDVGDLSEGAGNYSNERVVYIVPGGATKDIKSLVTGKAITRTIDASYLAVAVASLGLRNDPAEPLTNKTITGFNALVELFNESEMNNLAEAGCLVLNQRGSQIVVRHGITTSTNDVNSVEITLVQIRDYVVEAARTNLGEIYVGRKLKPNVVSDINVSLISILEQIKGQDVILGYSGVSVKRSKLDPRQVDVRFEIEAIYPLNYINIEFSFSQIS